MQYTPAVSDLVSAIEARCACHAALIQTVPVRAGAASRRSWGAPAWDVDVHIFELIDCGKASTAYAWRSDDRVFTALEIGPIRSPFDAVQAALADEARQRNLDLALTAHRA
jgi:hypothetical protein